jgi:hypothetical protein
LFLLGGLKVYFKGTSANRIFGEFAGVLFAADAESTIAVFHGNSVYHCCTDQDKNFRLAR